LAGADTVELNVGAGWFAPIMTHFDEVNIWADGSPELSVNTP